jgi:diadenosine tetraphosphatase ApaH/serine/threonine PP2A family protein phosphatase
MPVACLYDVHGNLPALEAVLADPVFLSADVVVVGGDVLPGPFPLEVVDALAALGEPLRMLRGNGDRQPTEWDAERLGSAWVRQLAALPTTLTESVAGLGEVLFCHGSPRSDEEIMTAISPPERVRPMLKGVIQPVVVCGHTHVQFDRLVDDTRIVNAGSVGMPYEADPGHAFWCLLGPGVELRHTPYDPQAAAARIAATACPRRRSGRRSTCSTSTRPRRPPSSSSRWRLEVRRKASDEKRTEDSLVTW